MGISKNSIISFKSLFGQPNVQLKTFVLPSKGEMICGNRVFREALTSLIHIFIQIANVLIVNT